MDPYQVLGVGRSASDAEIRNAYFQKVREFPPERQPQEFQRVRQAYEQLRTLEGRTRVEVFSFRPPPEAPPLPDVPHPAPDLAPVLDLLSAALKARCHEWTRPDLTDDFAEVEEQ